MGKNNWLKQPIKPELQAEWAEAITTLNIKAAENLIKNHGVNADQLIDVPGKTGRNANVRPLIYLLQQPDRGPEQSTLALTLMRHGANVGQHDELGLRASDYAVTSRNVLAGAYVFSITALSETLGAFPARREYPLNRAFAMLETTDERQAAIRHFASIHASARQQIKSMDEPYASQIAKEQPFWGRPFQMPALRDVPRPGQRTLSLVNEFMIASEGKRAELPIDEYETWVAQKDIEIYSLIRDDVRRAAKNPWPQNKPK